MGHSESLVCVIYVRLLGVRMDWELTSNLGTQRGRKVSTSEGNY